MDQKQGGIHVKHPVRDRLLILLMALVMLLGAAGFAGLASGTLNLAAQEAGFSGGMLNLPLVQHLTSWAEGSMSWPMRAALIVAAVVLLALCVLLIGVLLPSRRKRSSNYAVQHNENGMVRISLKAIDALVQKCLNQHAELKVVTSSLYSDEESVRVDVHITLQSDISMPLAISALQKQIKKYLEACSGVSVKEVRVFVDGTTPATEETARSPYAIPATLLGLEPDALPSGAQQAEQGEQDMPAEAPAPQIAFTQSEPEAANDETAEPQKTDEAFEPDGETAADGADKEEWA